MLCGTLNSTASKTTKSAKASSIWTPQKTNSNFERSSNYLTVKKVELKKEKRKPKLIYVHCLRNFAFRKSFSLVRSAINLLINLQAKKQRIKASKHTAIMQKLCYLAEILVQNKLRNVNIEREETRLISEHFRIELYFVKREKCTKFTGRISEVNRRDILKFVTKRVWIREINKKSMQWAVVIQYNSIFWYAIVVKKSYPEGQWFRCVNSEETDRIEDSSL